jgi:hypothetical protein
MHIHDLVYFIQHDALSGLFNMCKDTRWLRGIMPEWAHLLMGDTRHGSLQPYSVVAFRRYFGIHKPRYLGILVRMSLSQFRSALVLSYQKTLPESLSVLSVR